MHGLLNIIAEKAVSVGLALALLAAVPESTDQSAVQSSDRLITIRIAGSSTVRPLIERAVELYAPHHPKVQIIVGGGGSGRGIRRVGQSEVEIGMASRAVKDSELVEFPSLVRYPIGADGIALLVRADNPLENITTQQVRDVFSGKVTNWRALGGYDAPIRLISTNSRHGTFGAFCDHFGFEAEEEGTDGSVKRLRFKTAEQQEFLEASALAVDGNKPSLAAIMTKPDGLSYASVGSALRAIDRGVPLKMLRLDGVAPTEANLVDGSYRLQRPLLLLTNGVPRPAVKQFLDFVRGEVGQRLIRKLDCIPVSVGSGEGAASPTNQEAATNTVGKTAS